MANAFHCSLVTPEQQMLDETVLYASVPAWDGLVGIAPQRAPLLAKLGFGPLRLDFEAGGSRWFYIGGGLVQMKDNMLTLLANEAIPAENLVRQDVEASLKEAEARIATSDEAVAKKRSEVETAKIKLDLLDRIRNGI